jgi:hypothetical protein
MRPAPYPDAIRQIFHFLPFVITDSSELETVQIFKSFTHFVTMDTTSLTFFNNLKFKQTHAISVETDPNLKVNFIIKVKKKFNSTTFKFDRS